MVVEMKFEIDIKGKLIDGSLHPIDAEKVIDIISEALDDKQIYSLIKEV